VGVRPWDRVGEALRAPPDGPSDHNIGERGGELSGPQSRFSPWVGTRASLIAATSLADDRSAEWDTERRCAVGANALPIRTSGDTVFDRARLLLRDGRIDEALDWFEMCSTASSDASIRASSCAYAAGVLLSLGRPWEVASWADILRISGGSADLAALLEASAQLQFGDVDAALALIEHATAPSDPWFPCAPTTALIVRAHALYLKGEVDRATNEILDIYAENALAPEVWDAFARLCAETDFDPTPVVGRIADDDVLEVLAALVASEASGVDKIATLIWERDPADPKVLALVPSFAPRLESTRALEWSARMRAAGMGRTCPLLARADDPKVEPRERVRAAALVHASFGDKGGRESLEKAVPAVPDDELAAVLAEVWTLAQALTDSVVVAGATTARRSLRIAAGLFTGGAVDEAYAVLVHGLSMQDAESLVTEDVIAIMSQPVLEGLAGVAEARGEDDVAGILEAVAVVAAER
jgi:hypothetical protein